MSDREYYEDREDRALLAADRAQRQADDRVDDCKSLLEDGHHAARLVLEAEADLAEAHARLREWLTEVDAFMGWQPTAAVERPPSTPQNAPEGHLRSNTGPLEDK